jgi:ribose-phosphate pyrophosphokinase
MVELKVISGSSYPELAEKICKNLDIPVTTAQISSFADGEKYVRIEQNVRGDDVFIIQPITPQVNENLMELLIMIDAAKRASANKINVVAPYIGYMRQDRKARSREPITAKLVANLITTAGASRVCTFDLHQDQIQGFYDIPVDHFKAVPIFANYFASLNLQNLVVVAPDVGSTKRARDLAAILHCPIAIIHKARKDHNKSEILHLIGEVKGKNAIIVDDMIDTAGTITNAASHIKKNGAKDVYICATHAILSSPAKDRLQKCPAKKVVVIDSIKIPNSKKLDKIVQLPIHNIIAEMTLYRLKSVVSSPVPWHTNLGCF